MSAVPLEHVLILAALLFGIGVVGLLVRRNALFMLIAVEIMLNAAGLAFVGAGVRHADTSGQVMLLFILAMAAAEVSVGLALILRLRDRIGTLDTDAARSEGD